MKRDSMRDNPKTINRVGVCIYIICGSHAVEFIQAMCHRERQ